MGYKTFVSMNIAVIGTSDMAENFATRYADAGHEVFMANNNGDNKNIIKSLTLSDDIVFCSIENAAAIADLIVIATLPKEVREAAYWMGDVRGKVIIDATANLHSPEDELVNTAGAIKAITGSAHVVKVFSTRGYEQLLSPLFKKKNVQLVLSGDSKKAKEITKILTKDLGVNDFIDLGGDDTLPLFDEMTRCWRNLAEKTIQENRTLNTI